MVQHKGKNKLSTRDHSFRSGGGGTHRRQTGTHMLSRKTVEGKTHAIHTPHGTYLQSFRMLWHHKTVLLIFYDLLFWCLLFGGMLAYAAVLNTFIIPLNAPELDTLSPDELTQIGTELDQIVPKIFAIAILLTALLAIWAIAIWAVTRQLIWR